MVSLREVVAPFFGMPALGTVGKMTGSNKFYGFKTAAVILVTAAASFGLAALSGHLGWANQFGVTGAIYFLSGAALMLLPKVTPLRAIWVVAPWVLFGGTLALSDGLSHVYPIVVVAPLGALVGAYVAKEWKQRQRTRALVLALSLVGLLLMGTFIGMPNWISMTIAAPQQRSSAELQGHGFSYTEPARSASLRSAPRDFAGTITVLDFWTTTCAPCFRKFPELEEFSDAYADDPRVNVFAVNIISSRGDEPGQAEEMIGRFDYDFRKLYATATFAEAAEMYGFRGVPAVVIYDTDGSVAYVGSAEFNPLVLIGNVEREVEKLLAAESTPS